MLCQTPCFLHLTHRSDADRWPRVINGGVVRFAPHSLSAEATSAAPAIDAFVDRKKVPLIAPPAAAPSLLKFDTSKDGKVSLLEHRTATLANFDRLDTDKDGFVSQAERKAGGVGR